MSVLESFNHSNYPLVQACSDETVIRNAIEPTSTTDLSALQQHVVFQIEHGRLHHAMSKEEILWRELPTPFRHEGHDSDMRISDG
ncbi:hypothetical protein E4U09_007716 [Claviceps aff. purpurea]|uniref:Uncharacterized protein n=1 Tax=Claviceps aff. purpurea TaxID=1967640 RepID=A0A9P7QK72_9HYPO|nr:hypothetical protein E4U09_007716 [Claviceps aff. purpurea]